MYELGNSYMGYYNSKIMNQLSYHVDDAKLRNKGLRLNASLQKDIKETLLLFKGIKF